MVSKEQWPSFPSRFIIQILNQLSGCTKVDGGRNRVSAVQSNGLKEVAPGTFVQTNCTMEPSGALRVALKQKRIEWINFWRDSYQLMVYEIIASNYANEETFNRSSFSIQSQYQTVQQELINWADWQVSQTWIAMWEGELIEWKSCRD